MDGASKSKSRLLAPLVLDNRRRYCNLAGIQLVEEIFNGDDIFSAKKFKTEIMARSLKTASEGRLSFGSTTMSL